MDKKITDLQACDVLRKSEEVIGEIFFSLNNFRKTSARTDSALQSIAKATLDIKMWVKWVKNK